MLITVANAFLENSIFFVLLGAALLIPVKNREATGNILPPSLSLEFKGLAILTVILGHIGYFLSSNHDFLFPLSTISGAGVDIFLLLSGYGLTVSQLSRERSVTDFFKRTLPKLYIPLWITLITLFLADFFLLHKAYGLLYVVRSFAGLYPTADLFNDVNSPLWYFTWIIALYVFFRLTFSKKYIWGSAALVCVLSFAFLSLASYLISGSVIHLYLLHTLAFPLGMLLAWAIQTWPRITAAVGSMKAAPFLLRLVVLVAFLIVVWYFALRTNIPGFEQLISLLIVALFLLFFIIKKRHSFFLTLMGTYSFEIYLFHWPILYRYDLFYKILPAGIATAVYLAVFIGLGYLFNILISRFSSIISPQANTK